MARAPRPRVAREAAEPWLCATEAVRTRQPVLVSSFDEWQERYARSAAIAADGGYASSATLPLLAEGEAVGVLAFHFTAPVNFDDDYRDLLRVGGAALRAGGGAGAALRGRRSRARRRRNGEPAQG